MVFALSCGMEPQAHHEHHGGPLAVLICGTFNTNLSAPQYEFKRDNPFDVNQVLGRSPLETWARLKRTPGIVHMFSCTDKPIQSASFPWSGQWTFSSESQFERIYHCLKRIEPDLTKPRHSAYLRLRPDAVVLYAAECRAVARQACAVDLFGGGACGRGDGRSSSPRASRSLIRRKLVRIIRTRDAVRRVCFHTPTRDAGADDLNYDAIVTPSAAAGRQRLCISDRHARSNLSTRRPSSGTPRRALFCSPIGAHRPRFKGARFRQPRGGGQRMFNYNSKDHTNCECTCSKFSERAERAG